MSENRRDAEVVRLAESGASEIPAVDVRPVEARDEALQREADQAKAPPRSPVPGEKTSPPAIPSLGWWNAYFLGKLALYWYSVIGLHPLENLAFALVLLVPVQARWLARLRTVVAIPVAAALAYYDSWLPPFERLVAQSSNVAAFSLPYLIEIAGRFVSWPAVLLVVTAVAAYAALAKFLRVGVVVLGLLVALLVLQSMPQRPASQIAAAPRSDAGPGRAVAAAATADSDAKLDALLDAHFREEGSRQVRFSRPAGQAVPFDIVFLHVCSLSWDDLQAVGLDQHPLFARFDILLTRFNSAATYSGPAVIRLLRAPCGQSRHSALYSPAAEQCYLFPALQKAGYEPNLILNHDGHFDDLLGLIRKQGAGGIEPMALAGLPVPQRSFDGSPVYDDLAVLNRWADSLQSTSATRVAAVYNTISLHDGNRLTGGGGSSMDTYKVRLGKLLDDLDRFVARIEKGNRRMVIALIPEHGAAVRGDKMQISGMREIPTPAITLVPVGVMVVGPGAHRSGPASRVDAPTTHLALAHIVSRMLEHSPFERGEFRAEDYVSDLPATPYVAENADMVMLEHDDRYFLRMPNAGWSEYVAAASARTPRP